MNHKDEREAMLDEIRASGVKIHHKTGLAKLQSTLAAVRAGTYVEEAVPVAQVQAPKPAPVAQVPNVPATAAAIRAKRNAGKEQRATALVRIVVTPNDPLQSTYPGLIFTVGSSVVNKGRMIKKFVPFNNDEGWHVPQIICDQIQAAEMQKFKQVKMPNGEKQLQAYITKKFNVQILPMLTPVEMEELAAAQQARGSI